ncbi:MAG: TIGR03960 family B12-binding radical SAM protein [Firmicutes bacterium]|nr:TIGR03960 family B12-binding radical SAM protein [Bacillota bacterium]
MKTAGVTCIVTHNNGCRLIPRRFQGGCVLSVEQWLARILPRVSRPARYAGNEWNSVVKDHQQVDIRFALAFPDVYEVGMSYLGFKILYHVLNDRDDVAAERVFAPWPDMEHELRRAGRPLFSLETKTPLADFDLVGFTLQYEMSYTNIVNMLDLAGIPLRSADRRKEDPFIVGGGPGAFNPEPIAEYFDLFFLGEAEEFVHDLVELYLVWTKEDARREDFLARAVTLEGVYVPSLYSVSYRDDGLQHPVQPVRPGVPVPVRKRIVQDLDLAPYPCAPIVPFLDVVHDRAAVEVFRGCTRGCRFCQAGMIYRPVRERSVDVLREQVRELTRQTGYDEVSLASLSSTDYSAIADLIEEVGRDLSPQGVSVTLPSLRVDSFSVKLAGCLDALKKGGLTLAPEAGTQRLRDVINKRVTSEDMEESVKAAFEAGWQNIKLYFMIGLPSEEEADLDGIVHLVERVLALYRGRGGGTMGRGLRLHVSASGFVPKPHTPFQWEPQLELQELEKRQSVLKRKVRALKRKVELSTNDPRLTFLEAVFARGDRRLGRVIEEAWRLGARFDAWGEKFSFAKWLEAFQTCGIDPSFYANRRRGKEEIFPWDHLSAGVEKGFLWADYQESLRRASVDDCRFETCTLCGVCPELGTTRLFR